MDQKKSIGRDIKGMTWALVIIFLWVGLLSYLLVIEIDYTSPVTYLLVFCQMHLYTGLFITAHDAMHGLVTPHFSKLNRVVGVICASLFAYNFYFKLLPKHHEHHRFVATEKDPDYHHGNFWVWYFNFAKQYVHIGQIILMAITYNVLKYFFEDENVILYWMIPVILATFQLFYFGTYLPHRGTHEESNIHKARSQSKNHLWAFLTCYFFGYHYEHHAYPSVPWWLLYKVKK